MALDFGIGDISKLRFLQQYQYTELDFFFSLYMLKR